MALCFTKFESQLNLKKSEFLLNILNNYGGFIQSALGVCLDDARTGNDLNNNESEEFTASNEADAKKVFKAFEESIECKMLALEIVKSISNYFS